MAGLVKNMRRQAGVEIRGAMGKGGKGDAPVDISGLEDAKMRYEHLVGSVQGLAKDIRSVVSSELAIATKQHDLDMKVKQVAQILNIAGDSRSLDAEVVPTFVAGGNSLSSHVQAIQTGFLPHLDKITDRHKALSKDVHDNKQKKVDYEHYAHKVQSLEEKAKAKGNPKDFEHLESNKQKLQGSLEAFEGSSTSLMQALQAATQEIGVEVGLGLSSLAQANGSILSAEGEAIERLKERAPAWLNAAPPPSMGGSSSPPQKKSSKGNLLKGFGMGGKGKEKKGGAGGSPPALEASPPPGPPALEAPPPPPPQSNDEQASNGGELSYDELQAKLTRCEARNDAGAAAYEKLCNELSGTVEQLRDAEQKQHAAEAQLAAVKAELQQAQAGQQGTHAGEEVVELRRRLQEAEQHEQAYQIRLSSLERQLAEAKATPVSYPPVAAAPKQASLLDLGDASNPFGSSSPPAAQAHAARPPSQLPNQQPWNPFG